MNSVKISFILPSYNVALYLEQCVKSIEQQNAESYEIIIVDDGSRDNTLEIATSLAAQNSNITVIHQENGGVSKARNIGLANAKGVYVAFVDPDDFYISPFVNDFLEKADKYELDVIRGQYRICLDETLTDRGSLPFSKPETVLPGREYLKTCLLERTLEVVPFLGILRKEFLLENEISFPEGIGYEEDQIHLLKALLVPSCKVMQLNNWFYAYRQRSTSVTHNAKPKQIYDILKVLELEETELARHNLTKSELKVFNKYISASFYQITAIYVNLPKDERKKVYKAIPKHTIINSIVYPIRKRFAIKGLAFLLVPEALVRRKND